jgi:hypothetical protein
MLRTIFTKSIDDRIMDQSKLSKFLSSPEITEHVSELLYLLEFFSKTRYEQWADLPDDFAPCWVDIHHGNADTPILFLAMVCSCLIRHCSLYPYCHRFNDELRAFMNCEIHGLLDSWMIDVICNDHIFTKRPEDLAYGDDGISGADRIWVVLSRLCKIALDYDDWRKYPTNKLSFEHFVEKYATEYDPC